MFINLFLSISAALLFTFSYEYLKFPYLVFVSFVPLLFLLFRVKNIKNLFLYALLTCFIHNFLGFFWIAHSVKEFGELSTFYSYVVLFLFSIVTYWSFWIFLIILKYLNDKFYKIKIFNIDNKNLDKFGVLEKLNTNLNLKKSMLFFFFIIPSVFIISEYIDVKIFPLDAGSILILNNYLIQAADLLGSFGLSFFIMLVNVLVFLIFVIFISMYKSKVSLLSFIKNFKYFKNVLIYMSVIFTLFLLIFLYGNYKISYYENLKNKSLKINASIIQGNIGNSLKLEVGKALKIAKDLDIDPRRFSSSNLILKKYFKMTNDALFYYPETDIILWPETAFPGFFHPNESLMQSFMEKTKDIDQAFFIGAYYANIDKNGFYTKYYNSIVHVRDDKRIDYYHKKILLPFSEKMPLSDTFSFLKNLVPAMGDFSRGKGAKIFNQIVDGVNVKFASLICYEILIDSYVRKSIELEPNVLINVTNDSWFGDREPYNHLALAKVKAVQYRKPIIRVTNTGISSFIDKLGRSVDSKLKDEDIVNSNVYLSDPSYKTFYFKFGHLFLYGVIFILLYEIILRRNYKIYLFKKFVHYFKRKIFKSKE